jgi:hypothetical protein
MEVIVVVVVLHLMGGWYYPHVWYVCIIGMVVVWVVWVEGIFGIGSNNNKKR